MFRCITVYLQRDLNFNIIIIQKDHTNKNYSRDLELRHGSLLANGWPFCLPMPNLFATVLSTELHDILNPSLVNVLRPIKNMNIGCLIRPKTKNLKGWYMMIHGSLMVYVQKCITKNCVKFTLTITYNTTYPINTKRTRRKLKGFDRKAWITPWLEDSLYC